MSICLFEEIFHHSNLKCAVKCQERLFNENQLEALIGWVFNGLLFFGCCFILGTLVFTEILVKF